MPGRQSHGRSLMGGNAKPASGKRTNQKSKTKARAHALDAFSIASKQIQPDRLTRRGRDLELDPEKQSKPSGSDSEGNEWHVGVNGDDDDSEIESDEAFGDSDDEKFEGYAFRGSRSQKEEDDEDGDDGESLGSEAIDLADALDQSSSDDDEEGSQGDTDH
ncbi:hypothetical protein VP1G_10737 [Cytospora mali]|uniref:Uncharacterized protein n=1 Tax=Cytospora mali TaxID=578113 RepID=A0A194UVS4_CYTMA|nr:hypothetical protein VP1G_10737 [Valsa mali var. pyri (nom. inval.)]